MNDYSSMRSDPPLAPSVVWRRMLKGAPIGLASMSGQSPGVMHTSDKTMLRSVRVRSIGAEISVPTLSAVLRGHHGATLLPASCHACIESSHSAVLISVRRHASMSPSYVVEKREWETVGVRGGVFCGLAE